MVKSCWIPSAEGDEHVQHSGDSKGRVDGLLWYKDLGQHAYGGFSMATIQANVVIEDQSQLVSGPLASTSSGPHGTFVGVYDGHGGTEASKYVIENLLSNLKRLVYEHQGVSEHIIKKAFLATDENFLSVVKKMWLRTPQIASAGTCCLVGMICNGLLYIANAGDSRAVLGRTERATHEVRAIQLSTEHNASIESVREEIQNMHPYDPHIVVLRHKVWRVKGLIQVTRSIGDAYLKKAEFNREPLLSKFRLPETFFKPILSPEPSISVRKLCREDKFVIFATDGLWEHLSNQEAVNIVNSSSQNGAATRLVKAALKEAAKKREMRYSDLKKIEAGVRRHFHDDITVIVVFIDPNLINGCSLHYAPVSIKGGGLAPNF